ncbi:hypothetical protein [Herbaspirillum rhizosphaerae]|uniref:hypothetical protein n=1 Tax=Herbaspirillum rhizosphaerae TaxID=346179 RepID=UPI00067D25AC|nr:hypothetical protein [Herbaspirillum rhizosphaerae]
MSDDDRYENDYIVPAQYDEPMTMNMSDRIGNYFTQEIKNSFRLVIFHGQTDINAKLRGHRGEPV